jgi:Spy/CpxP family protein refolding chaperone
MSNSPVRRAVRAAVQLAAAASFVAVATSQVSAQAVSKDPPAGQPPAGGGMGGGGANRMNAMLFEGITLTADQQHKVDSITAFYREKSMALGRPQQGDTTGMGARRQIATDRNAAIKAVLTADQQKTFDANLAKMPQGRGMGGGRPPGAPTR